MPDGTLRQFIYTKGVHVIPIKHLIEYGISQLTSHQCSRALAECRDVMSIVVTSSKNVGNFDRRSNLT